MQEQMIVDMALENLKNNTKILGTWVDYVDKEIEGKIAIEVNNKRITFFVEIKKEIRQQQLHNLEFQAKQFKPLIVIAERIFPNLKTELRGLKIAYLEANGNIFIQEEDIFIFIDTQKPLQRDKNNINRAFTKTGLKVLFNFLLDDGFINLTYREIAAKAGVALGNINLIIHGLNEKGFIIQINKNRKKLINKDGLLKLWLERYEEKLKPDLLVGTFRFLDKNDFINWKNIKFENIDTVWGGEPAAALLTNYLTPEILTIYTHETKADLMKNYKLIPDPVGNVKIYQRFWETNGPNKRTVPPILIYADLINTGDNRNIETANMIFNEHIKDKY